MFISFQTLFIKKYLEKSKPLTFSSFGEFFFWRIFIQGKKFVYDKCWNFYKEEKTTEIRKGFFIKFSEYFFTCHFDWFKQEIRTKSIKAFLVWCKKNKGNILLERFKEENIHNYFFNNENEWFQWWNFPSLTLKRQGARKKIVIS